jgi:hypothetical protein
LYCRIGRSRIDSEAASALLVGKTGSERNRHLPQRLAKFQKW